MFIGFYQNNVWIKTMFGSQETLLIKETVQAAAYHYTANLIQYFQISGSEQKGLLHLDCQNSTKLFLKYEVVKTDLTLATVLVNFLDFHE